MSCGIRIAGRSLFLCVTLLGLAGCAQTGAEHIGPVPIAACKPQVEVAAVKSFAIAKNSTSHFSATLRVGESVSFKISDAIQLKVLGLGSSSVCVGKPVTPGTVSVVARSLGRVAITAETGQKPPPENMVPLVSYAVLTIKPKA